MRQKLLTIAIPTYNRANYLNELLNCIILNIQDLESDVVDINILDNNSSDNTFAVVEKYQKYLENLNYYKNQTNIGADLNIYKAYTTANTKYVWVIGDDELLEKNIIKKIIKLLKDENPALIIFYYNVVRGGGYGYICKL